MVIQAIVKKGVVFAEKVSAPIVTKGSLLIRVENSCISAGTELSGVKISGTPLIKRAMNQPEKVKKVISWVKSDGIAATYKKVKGELESGKPTGYSLSGIVIGIGDGVKNFEIGERVSASGGGLANHAEYVDVPINLVAKIPETLNMVNASTVTLGAIALQGIRRADLKLGEFATVFGAGILGLLTIQILKASGIRVSAVDLDEKRLSIAKEFGAEITINPGNENPVNLINSWSNGHGVDAVLFTAATNDDEPLSQSFQMCRRKGKVILVGVSGMNIKRQDMYSKELDFLISTSYGPGRYDNTYEKEGVDYPYAYVRWTENRNIAEYLRLLDSKQIKIDSLIEHIYPISEVSKAFASLHVPDNKPLMVILDYSLNKDNDIENYKLFNDKPVVKNLAINKSIINVALVGIGNFTKNTHLPNLQKLNKLYNIHAAFDRSGYNAKFIGGLSDSVYSTTNYDDILNDPDIELVLIGTRHDSHGEFVLKALNAGKHVFVEKPLAVNQDELDEISNFYRNDNEHQPLLFVGYNRRFSKYAQEIKKHVDNRINPLFINYRMNAGFISPDHWVHKNGGRIIGEACHIIDLMTFFINSEIQSISGESLSPATDKFSKSDNKSIILKYIDGSVATISYLAVGNKEVPKEYMEIHFDEKSIILEDYKSLKGYGLDINQIKTATSQKGHLEELKFLHEALVKPEADWPIELWDLVQTTQTTLLLS